MVKVTDMLAAQAGVASKATRKAVGSFRPVADPAPASEAPSPPSEAEKPVSAHVPAKVIDASVPTGGVSQPSSVQPASRGTLAALTQEQHKRNGTPDDEPIAIIHRAIGVNLDRQQETLTRFDKILSRFGPDAAKQAAEAAAFAANQAVSDGVKRITLQIGALRLAGTLALCAIVASASWYIRGTMDRNTEIGYIPKDMAEIVHLQDWSSQWEKRIIQNRTPNGYEWALMPVVTKAPPVN